MDFDPQRLWTEYRDLAISAGLNVLAAAAILIFGLWLAAWAAGAVRRFAARHRRVDTTLAAFFSWIVRYAIIGFVIIAVLNRFGVATTSIVAVLGATTLAIGLALQGTLSNVAAGVMLILFRPYRLSDEVEIAGRTGIVCDITLFTTELIGADNVKVVLPNAVSWGQPIVNFSAHQNRRFEVDVGVHREASIEEALAILTDVLEREKRVHDKPSPRAFVKSWTDVIVHVTLQGWCEASQVNDVRGDLATEARRALEQKRLTPGLAPPKPAPKP